MREKLVELLCEARSKSTAEAWFSNATYAEQLAVEADHLIANGVTVTDNNVGGKWIAVKERFPDLVPCSAGTAYSEAVNVLTTGRKVLTAIWNGSYWICDAEFWEAEFEEITHWTPVLLPLPEPPKGE
jgi:hypothetical protein